MYTATDDKRRNNIIGDSWPVGLTEQSIVEAAVARGKPTAVAHNRSRNGQK